VIGIAKPCLFLLLPVVTYFQQSYAGASLLAQKAQTWESSLRTCKKWDKVFLQKWDGWMTAFPGQ